MVDLPCRYGDEPLPGAGNRRWCLTTMNVRRHTSREAKQAAVGRVDGAGLLGPQKDVGHRGGLPPPDVRLSGADGADSHL